MEIYILTLKEDGVRTFHRIENAYNFTIEWLKKNNLYTNENFKELRETYNFNCFTGFKIGELVKCHRTIVEDYKEEF